MRRGRERQRFAVFERGKNCLMGKLQKCRSFFLGVLGPEFWWAGQFLRGVR
jgi:hypothetical protein